MGSVITRTGGHGRDGRNAEAALPARRRLHRWAMASAVGALLCLGLPVVAQADTIGGNANPASRECAGGVSAVDTAPAYTVPANGTISSFAFQSVAGSAGDQLAFKVFRPLEVSIYEVVGTTAVVTLATATNLETFTPPAPIAVEAGDVLGFWIGDAGVTGCGIDAPGNNSVFFLHIPNPGVGAIVPMVQQHDLHLNVSAQFTPTPTDTTPPVIEITTPADGATYNLDSTVPADYGCEDPESGIFSCAGPVANGDPIDTGSLGAHSFTVDAANGLGLTSSLTNDYTVRACLNLLPVGDDANNVINGTAESDAAFGRRGNDTIRGRESVDCLKGNIGDDRLEGDSGDDQLDGGDGFDRLFGDAGDDRITANGDLVRDSIDCGPGADTVKASLTDSVLANCENVRRTAT